MAQNDAGLNYTWGRSYQMTPGKFQHGFATQYYTILRHSYGFKVVRLAEKEG